MDPDGTEKEEIARAQNDHTYARARMLSTLTLAGYVKEST
jgi:hypothetical protein